MFMVSLPEGTFFGVPNFPLSLKDFKRHGFQIRLYLDSLFASQVPREFEAFFVAPVCSGDVGRWRKVVS